MVHLALLFRNFGCELGLNSDRKLWPWLALLNFDGRTVDTDIHLFVLVFFQEN